MWLINLLMRLWKPKNLPGKSKHLLNTILVLFNLLVNISVSLKKSDNTNNVAFWLKSKATACTRRLWRGNHGRWWGWTNIEQSRGRNDGQYCHHDQNNGFLVVIAVCIFRAVFNWIWVKPKPITYQLDYSANL